MFCQNFSFLASILREIIKTNKILHSVWFLIALYIVSEISEFPEKKTGG